MSIRCGRAGQCLLVGLLLIVVTLAVYWQALGHEFLGYDDSEYITDNPRVQAGLTSGSVKWAFTTTHSANWHPLT